MDSKDNIKNFCQNLRHMRKVYKLNQKEMAEILGISVEKLRRIEKCDPNVRIYAVHLCRACDYFQKSCDEMLFENWPEMLAEKYSL